MPMKTLRDILTRRGPGGQLVKSSGEELQTLAGKAGLSAPPIQPLGAQSIGATDHQVKMVGTPAQKQAALSIASGEEQRLSDATRRQQVRTTATAEEEARKKRAKDLGQELTNVPERVQSLIDSYLPKMPVATEAPAPTTIQISKDLATIEPTRRGAATVALQSYVDLLGGRNWAQLTPEEQQAALSKLNEATLAAGFTTAISPEEVPNLLQSVGAAVGTTAAQATQDASTVTVANLISQGGLSTTAEELGQLLGVPPQEVANYSLTQLQGAIGRIEAEEEARVEELRSAIADPFVGQAERAAARQQLLEMSGVGTRGIHEQVDSILESVERGELVEFGGQAYTVQDLLTDSSIENIVAKYLEAPEGDPFRKQLEATEPEFVDYVRAHAKAFSAAVGELQKGVKEYSDIQKFNQEQTKLLSGLGLSPEVQKLATAGLELGEDGKALSDRRIDLSKAKPILEVLKKPESAVLVSQLNKLADSPVTAPLLPELMELSEPQLRKIGIYDNSPAWQNFLAYSGKKAAIEAADTPDEVLTEYFGMPLQYEELGNILSTEKKLETLGLSDNYTNLSRLLDSDGNGELDSPGELNRQLAATLPEHSLADLLAGKTTPATTGGRFTSPEVTSTQTYRLLAPYAGDGEVTPQELAAILSSGKLSRDDLVDTSFGAKLAPAEEEFDRLLRTKRMEHIVGASGASSTDTLSALPSFRSIREGRVPTPAELTEAEDRLSKGRQALLGYLTTLPEGSDMARVAQDLLDSYGQYSKMLTRVKMDKGVADARIAAAKALEESGQLYKVEIPEEMVDFVIQSGVSIIPGTKTAYMDAEQYAAHKKRLEKDSSDTSATAVEPGEELTTLRGLGR